MSSGDTNVQSTRNLPGKGEQGYRPMRGGWSGWSGWSEEEQARIDIQECTDARCMNVDVNVGYQGLADGSVLSQSAGVGDELRAAWKTKLEREGKFNSAATSLRTTIIDSPKSE